MESVASQKLANILNKIDSTSIPNYDLVRPLLYNIFVIETGPVCTLITQYYITGRRGNDQSFLYDPADQARWCVQNLPYFSNVARRSRQVRNKLVHNDFLTVTLFKDTLYSFIDLSCKTNQSSFVMDMLLDQFYAICETIFSGKTLECNTSLCPLCRSPLSTENKNVENMGLPQEIITHTDLFPVSQPLIYWKNNGWKDKLKGSKIKIMDGMWKDYEGVFRSWAGTSSYVDLKGEGRKALRLTTLVLILDQ